MAHIVYVQARDAKRFNYVKFGPYTKKNGKKAVLLNPDDLPIEGWEMYDAMTSLNIEDQYDKRIYEFLLDHPFIEGDKFNLIDTKANVSRQAEDILKSADAVRIATKLSTKEFRDMAKLTGIGTDFDDDIIKAKLIQIASKTPIKFLEIFNDADKDYRIFLKTALDKQVIQKVNDVWKHGNYTLGISDEHAIAWLKDNSEVYAIMKNQLRGNKKIKVADVLETVDTSDMVTSSGTKALEKAVDAKKGK